MCYLTSKITTSQNIFSIYLNSGLNMPISHLIYLTVFIAMLE